MTKQELYNYILVNTNQYFVGSENFEISEPVLDGLIWKALNIWGQYNPARIISPINIDKPKINVSIIEDSFGIKRQIYSITGIYFDDYTKYPFDDAKENLKVPFNWIYDNVRNVLMFPNAFESNIYYIESICSPTLDDINRNDDDFLDLMVGLALVYIGHNRTDFTLSELPFDIRDLRDEGQQIIDKVKEDLENQNNSNWYYAIDML